MRKHVLVPYTYLITFLKTGQRYYGVRFSKSCHPSELGKTYFSSSKIINSLIKENGVESFTFEVRKIFDNIEKAQKWESRILQRLDVRHSDKWINKHNNIGPFYANGTHSKETRLKISIANTGKKLSEERKIRISESQKGRIKSADHLAKISKSLKGKQFSLIHRKRISEGMKGVSPSLEARKKISLALTGRIVSPETGRKISESKLNKSKQRKLINVDQD